jgi:hypothetical protein
LTCPHLSVHRLIISHDAARVNAEAHLTVGFFANFFGKVFELLNPDRTARSEGGDLEKIFRRGLQEAAAEKEEK